MPTTRASAAITGYVPGWLDGELLVARNEA